MVEQSHWLLARIKDRTKKSQGPSIPFRGCLHRPKDLPLSPASWKFHYLAIAPSWGPHLRYMDLCGILQMQTIAKSKHGLPPSLWTGNGSQSNLQHRHEGRHALCEIYARGKAGERMGNSQHQTLVAWFSSHLQFRWMVHLVRPSSRCPEETKL